VRQAELMKVPYMLVVGDREEEHRTVAVRSRGAGDEGVQPIEVVVERLVQEIAARR
jgi:threonyl-tRNA synthetase